jgi:drug efflux transport system ATP-binding protein
LAEILASGLHKRLGGVEVLRGVDVRVQGGALVGLVGPDGAGKTTLLRCIAGLYEPDAGSVLPGVEGQLELGFAQQGFHLYGELTVQENVEFIGAVYGLGPGELSDRAERLLAFAGLSQVRSRRAAALSGGMRQKLTLVCSLLHSPPVLLLDEPTTGVDPVSRREFWELVQELHVEGSTILLASSYFDEVERCERVVYLDEGRVVADGDPEELRGEHESLEAAFVRATS